MTTRRMTQQALCDHMQSTNMDYKTAIQTATREVIDKVHAYMRAHPESELHRCGKMFGVLLYAPNPLNYIAAFSAKLDGSYHHEDFVPPVYEMPASPVGHSKTESQRLQRLLFAQYNFLNSKGEKKNLLDIFANESPILSPEEWFEKDNKTQEEKLPPSGAGECCAPKLLQYAFVHKLQPIALAEFWIGAPSHTEIRQEGRFYVPCSGKCRPILKHMLQGLALQIEGEIELKTNYSKVPDILYEDEWLMVVNKPAGLLAVPGKSDAPSVESMMGAKPVHRLDQDTSGLLVLSKTPEVYKELQAYFQRRDILKRYEAVCRPNKGSKVIKDEGEINLPLLPNPFDRPRQMVNIEHGKPAITRYIIREHREDGSILVNFFPHTGRTHQLRVHAAHPDGLNAPILGDRLYNGLDAKPNRLMLHAAEIRFIHPITKEEMLFSIPSHF